MPVTISIRNRNQLERDLQRQINVLNDQTQLWDTVIRNVLVPRIRETFASRQVSADGNPVSITYPTRYCANQARCFDRWCNRVRKAM